IIPEHFESVFPSGLKVFVFQQVPGRKPASVCLFDLPRVVAGNIKMLQERHQNEIFAPLNQILGKSPPFVQLFPLQCDVGGSRSYLLD
ncbi:hypothetical protein ABTK74_19535, partial [Acinetobacter baumannii]